MVTMSLTITINPSNLTEEERETVYRLIGRPISAPEIKLVENPYRSRTVTEAVRNVLRDQDMATTQQIAFKVEKDPAHVSVVLSKMRKTKEVSASSSNPKQWFLTEKGNKELEYALKEVRRN